MDLAFTLLSDSLDEKKRICLQSDTAALRSKLNPKPHRLVFLHCYTITYLKHRVLPRALITKVLQFLR